MVDQTADGAELRRYTTIQGCCTCFMDGPQRVAVFSRDEEVSCRVFSGHGAEISQLDAIMSLNAVVVSLINDDIGQEIATIGLTS